MMIKHNNSIGRQAGILFCLLICCVGWVKADEFFYGGMVVDIDYTVDGWVWIADATVNMYENAWIRTGHSVGEVWAESGAVLNIYGGTIDYLLIITTSYSSTLPEAQVTVFGSDFTVDGVPVEPGTTELFLNNNVLGGVYESGTEIAIPVACFAEGSFYMTIKLGWIESAPRIDVTPDAIDFGEVELGQVQTAFVTIANTGSGNLSLQALAIEQADETDFGFMPLAQLPMTMEPNSLVEVEVVFVPAAEGPYEAYLLIYSDDPDFPVVEVMLTGVGFEAEEAELTTKDKIDVICVFYRESLNDGTIAGTGPGRSGHARAAVIGTSLAVAQHLINAGYDRLALIPLKSVASKTTGRGWPRDFVAGPATADLNAMVEELIEDIQDGYPRYNKKGHSMFCWKNSARFLRHGNK